MSLLSKLNGSLWAMEETALADVRMFIENSVDMSDVDFATGNRGVAERDKDKPYGADMVEESGKMGKISVTGKIMPRATIMSASAGTSCEKLMGALEYAEDKDSIEKVLMTFDSPGGAGVGVPDVAETIRDMETETVAYAHGTMASAAYWIGSAADKVYANRIAQVGSIGVYMMLTSYSDKLDEEGIDVEVIRSAEMKGAGNKMEPIGKDTVKMYQEQIDRLHEEFVSEVALNRNLDTDYVMNEMADGQTRVGEDGEPDFVDGVLSLSELYEEEFSFDSDSDMSRDNAQIEFLETQYVEVAENLSEARQKNERLQERVDELEEEVESSMQSKIDAKLDGAIEDGKIKPGNRAAYREKLEENFDSASEMIDMIPEGAASPESGVFTKESATDDTGKRKALESKGMVAVEDPQELEIYEKTKPEWEDGTDYFRAYALDEYDVEA